MSELAIKFREAVRRIKSAMPQVYVAEKTDESLDKLLESSERELLPTLQLTADNKQDYSFVDIYAQTIAYALFTARGFSYIRDKRSGTIVFDRELARQQLPEISAFLRRLFEDVSQHQEGELRDELTGTRSLIFLSI